MSIGSDSSSYSLDGHTLFSARSSRPATPLSSLVPGAHQCASGASSLRNEWHPSQEGNSVVLHSSTRSHDATSTIDATVSPRKNYCSSLTITKTQEKGPYHCTTATCKELSAIGLRSSYGRHEEGHWFRYRCLLCHGKVSLLLRELGCTCKEYPQPDWFHLDLHRIILDRQNSQEKTKLWMRKSGLEKHLQDDHGMSQKAAQSQANASRIQAIDTTACGICDEDVLYSDRKSMGDHMWDSHWQKNHTMSMWTDDRVIKKLLTLRPELSPLWQAITTSHGYRSQGGTASWRDADFRRLRRELELGQFGCRSHFDLVSMACNYARFSNLKSANGFPDGGLLQYVEPSNPFTLAIDDSPIDIPATLLESHLPGLPPFEGAPKIWGQSPTSETNLATYSKIAAYPRPGIGHRYGSSHSALTSWLTSYIAMVDLGKE